MDQFSKIVEPCIKSQGTFRIDQTEIDHKIQNVIIQKMENLNKNDKLELLLKAVSFIDLTSLEGKEDPSIIENLCSKAIQPLQKENEQINSVHTAAVCVYSDRVSFVLEALERFKKVPKVSNKKINIASVAAGFPSGQFPLEERLDEIRQAIKFGANEIDVVIDRKLANAHNWFDLYKELLEMRKACESVKMKTILSVGELNNLEDVYIASMVAMAAGSDFIKTSTGKEVVNATLPVGIVMCRAIKDFNEKTGQKIGFKPAGGIRAASDALSWLILVQEELGDEWLNPSLFRIGASSLLDDIVLNIEMLL